MSEASRTRQDGIGGDTEEIETHESYGVINASRFTCNPTDFFGTPVKCAGGIEFTLHRAERSFHRISGERFVPRKIIAQFRMTPVQFAELITTMNAGQGVPCTLDLIPEGCERLQKLDDPPPQQSEAKQIREEFGREMDEALATLKAAKRRVGKLLDESKIGKGRRQEIEHEIFELMRKFEDSAPFVMGQVERAAKETASTAKAEIAAYAGIVAEQTGVEMLRSGGEHVVPEIAAEAGHDEPYCDGCGFAVSSCTCRTEG